MPGPARGRGGPSGATVSSGAAGFQPARQNERPENRGAGQQQDARAERDRHDLYLRDADDDEGQSDQQTSREVEHECAKQDHGHGWSQSQLTGVTAVTAYLYRILGPGSRPITRPYSIRILGSWMIFQRPPKGMVEYWLFVRA